MHNLEVPGSNPGPATKKFETRDRDRLIKAPLSEGSLIGRAPA